MYIDLHAFQGVKRATHLINQSSEYLWDAHNIRFEDKKDGTYMSIVNETMPKLTGISLLGKYVGHCILNQYLIVFVHNEYTRPSLDLIYRIEYKDGRFISNLVFYGILNLSPEHPIQALGVYESETILKVYWIDDINLPRLINIADRLDGDTPNVKTLKSLVDFVSDLTLRDKFSVSKSYTRGMFSPGVILYAISLYNKYGAETSIIYTSPLQYIAPSDRGAKGDELVLCCFDITIEKIGYESDLNNFEYIRVYSIHRVEQDLVPTVKRVFDIKIDKDKSKYTVLDDGTLGEIVDPASMAYIGGEQIIAGCMEAKDGTLFFGNIKNDRLEAFKKFKDSEYSKRVREEYITFEDFKLRLTDNDNGKDHYYSTPVDIFVPPGFKKDELYRCGILFLYKNGKWSEPIFIGDKVLNDKDVFTSGSIMQYSKRILLSETFVNDLKNAGFLRARACVVFPSVGERRIITLGVLAPTVFNILGRNTAAPYALPSWFFRPKAETGVQFIHNKSLHADLNNPVYSEILGAKEYSYDDANIPSEDYQSTFFVDENIVTMHSPDIEWDSSLANVLYDNLRVKAVGIACMDAVFGVSDVTIGSERANLEAAGFTTKRTGYTTNSGGTKNIGISTLRSFLDGFVTKSENNGEYTYKETKDTYNYPVYLWHRSGSLNNDDGNNNDRVRYAELQKKIIGNLEYFKYNKTASTPVWYSNIGKPIFILENQETIEKISIPGISKDNTYLSTIDTAITHGGLSYKLLPDNDVPLNGINESTDLVRMKYRTTNHIVLSLGGGNSTISVLPIAEDKTETELDINGNKLVLPEWDVFTEGSEGAVSYTPDDNIDAFATGGFLTNKDNYINMINPLIYGVSMQYSHRFFTVNQVDGSLVLLPSELFEGKILSIGYTGKYASGQRYGVTKALGEGALNILLPMCGSKGQDAGTLNLSSYFIIESGTGGNDDTRVYRWRNDAERLIVKVHKVNGLIRFEKLRDADSDTLPGGTDQKHIFSIDLKVLDVTADTRPYMIIAELWRNTDPKFGGDTEEALFYNQWLPAGESVYIENDVKVPFEYGDTWVSRYDCMKTFPYSDLDENQVIEIGSFLLEARVNIDGRTDRNRGNLGLTTLSPLNFNLYNTVYNLKDNFFNYRIYDKDYYNMLHWKNQVTWTLEKWNSSEIDPWTLILLSNILDIDGDKGEITAIVNYNNTLYYFQKRSFGELLFNNRVQIPTSDGTPIEITNGYKMEGIRVLSNNLGCLDKWAIVQTPTGLYFVDSLMKTLWLHTLNDGSLPLDFSTSNGMSYWFRKNCRNIPWVLDSGIRLGYDSVNKDIYFSTGKNDNSDALCYSESMGTFTGTYDYTGVPPFAWEGNTFSLILGDEYLDLVQHNVLDTHSDNSYITFISNALQEGLGKITKIFDSIEFKTDVLTNGNAYNKILPFKSIEISNEYQEGILNYDNSTLKKKFRIWRGYIPRISDTANGFRNVHARARARNPWLLIKLNLPNLLENKFILHDLVVKYTI